MSEERRPFLLRNSQPLEHTNSDVGCRYDQHLMLNVDGSGEPVHAQPVQSLGVQTRKTGVDRETTDDD